jgi:predicted transcriptional regulator
MTRSEAIAHISAALTLLPDDRVQELAELADAWVTPLDDQPTRLAIARGLAQAQRGEFATDAEVKAAFAKFRS